MQTNVKELVKKLTLEEKARLCSGRDFWSTVPIERLQIPSIFMTDGPHGLRKQAAENDTLGLNQSVPSTCFPSAAGLACSWDKELLEKVGQLIGEECLAEDVSILLGPAVNIKRSPLCGRNFEYYSEDPFLTGELAAAFISGVQSKGVGTSLKHFAANNQETNRMTIDARVEERALREIYLKGFEIAVKKSQPWTVMCAYNRLNGTYCSENEYLLTEILRKEWGFRGFVVSDWSAVNVRSKALAAGLDLEMPFSNGVGERDILRAIQEKTLRPEALDLAVERILECVLRAQAAGKDQKQFSVEAHHQTAQTVASECMVLLKNENKTLPIAKHQKIAVIGTFAAQPRYQGGGSSHITPTKLDSPLEEIKKQAESSVVTYAEGYRLNQNFSNELGKAFEASAFDEPDAALIEQACKTAAAADVAVIFAGLPEHFESEGYDRIHLSMPEAHNQLIQAVANVQKKVIVVLQNGSPVEMPWIDQVSAVLESYLGGQGGGRAVASLLFGKQNPCGKLAETFPKALCDNPSYLNFPGLENQVTYGEGVFVGYRYYDYKKIEPLFPFGFGLSYTTFQYSNLQVSKTNLTEGDSLQAVFRIRNTGDYAGKETAQLYIRPKHTQSCIPEKELKGFAKVSLQPGEEKEVVISLDQSAFSHYDTQQKGWHAVSGDYEICIGSSSRDIRLKTSVSFHSSKKICKTYTMNSTMQEIIDHPVGKHLLQDQLESLTGFLLTSPLRAVVSMMNIINEEEAQHLLKELNAADSAH